jgi:hypothetical protein
VGAARLASPGDGRLRALQQVAATQTQNLTHRLGCGAWMVDEGKAAIAV